MKALKILFFINGHSPSQSDLEAAVKLSNSTVCYRNKNAVPNEQHSIEVCDGVAGDVPAIYAKAFPKADAAISKREAEEKERAKRIGDRKAPKAAKAAESKAADGKQTDGKATPANPAEAKANAEPKKQWTPNG